MRSRFNFIFILLICFQSCITQKFKPVPYQQTTYYNQTQNLINKYQPSSGSLSDTVNIGWAKVNITPFKNAPMAGYGKRKGKYYKEVHDSVWVRAFVFKTKTHKAAWVSADLLIMPMSVTERLKELLPTQGFKLNNTYLTATHTHYSFGGWGKKPAGRIMAGKYNHNQVETIAQSVIKALVQAEKSAEPARLGYQEINAPEFLYNRLAGENGSLDPYLRVVHFQKQSGKEAMLLTYAAHPTSVASTDLRLSAEYPGLLVQLLENKLNKDMVAFGAGAMGSHGPKAPGEEYEKVGNLANGLAAKVISQFNNKPTLAYETKLQTAFFPVALPKPQWRFNSTHQFRPWVFYTVFGRYAAGLSLLQVGNLVFVGTPCDFSGELIPDLTLVASKFNKQLIVTGFNGSYIGYVTPEKYFNFNKYETRDMNFFGPYTGTYMQELIKTIIKKAE